MVHSLLQDCVVSARQDCVVSASPPPPHAATACLPPPPPHAATTCLLLVSAHSSPPQDPASASARASADLDLARTLMSVGLPGFLSSWYATPMWARMRQHPAFDKMMARRRSMGTAGELACALASMSTGRMVGAGCWV